MTQVILSRDQSLEIIGCIDEDDVQAMSTAISRVAGNREIQEESWGNWQLSRNMKQHSLFFVCATFQAWHCLFNLAEAAFKPTAWAACSDALQTSHIQEFDIAVGLLHANLRVRSRNGAIDGMDILLKKLMGIYFSRDPNLDRSEISRMWMRRSDELDLIIQHILASMQACEQQASIKESVIGDFPSRQKGTL